MQVQEPGGAPADIIYIGAGNLYAGQVQEGMQFGNGFTVCYFQPPVKRNDLNSLTAGKDRNAGY